MANRDSGCQSLEASDPVTRLEDENACLRREIRVAHQAAEITAQLVVEQFVKTDAILTKFQSTNSQLQAVLDAASQISIIATDLEGMITLFNKGAEMMLGYHAGEMVGRQTPAAFHLSREMAEQALELTDPGEPPPEGIALFARLADMGSAGIREWTYRRKDGHCLPVSLSITPIRGNDRVVVGYLGVAMDITQIQEAHQRLSHANEELARANLDLQKLDQLKSELLSSVSHELRTPLTSIRGFTQLIRREFERTFAQGESDPKRKRKGERILENLEIIQIESERLTRLINDVLDLAKIESGRLQWNDTLFPLQKAVQQAANAARGQFDTGVALLVDAVDPAWTLNVDRDRVVQVLVNLLNNAAKFTDAGQVRISCQREGKGWVRLAVVDTGRGFPPEDAQIIFDKFQQARHGDTLQEKAAGTGLGLSICREIVTHYGGRIWATSQPGVGSTFSLTLPLQVRTVEEEAPSGEIPHSREAPFSGEKEERPPLVLVVDDDPGVLSYLRQFLQENEFAVVTAGDGEKALEVAQEHRPDLITMDLDMPVMDGRTAILRLRADPRLRHIPIIVLTAMPDKEAAGGDLSFNKPLDEEGLLNGARLLISGQRMGREAEQGLEATPCLVLSDPEMPLATPVPETISTGPVTICHRDELLLRVREGFQGLVVVPAELLHRLDGGFLEKISALQVLILPSREEPDEKDPRMNQSRIDPCPRS